MSALGELIDEYEARIADLEQQLTNYAAHAGDFAEECKRLNERLARAEKVIEAAKVKCLGSCPNGWGSQVCDGPCGWLDLCAALAEWEGSDADQN